MPVSPFLSHTGIGVIAAVSMLGVMATLLTLAASTLILWRYRRAVARFMASHAGEVPVTADVRAATGAAAGKVMPHARPEHRGGQAWYAWIAAGQCRLARDYATAGLAWALFTGACCYVAFSQTQVNFLQAASHPLQLLVWVVMAAWPVVLTVTIVAPGARRVLWLLVSGYFIVFAALGTWLSLTPTEAAAQLGEAVLPAWSGESPLRVAGRWCLFNGLPTLLTLLFRRLRVRAVAPLVLAFMTVVSAGVMGMMTAAYWYWEPAVNSLVRAFGINDLLALAAYFVVLLAWACLLFGVAGWGLMAWLRGAYLRKIVSDQSLAVDALWLIFAACYAVMLAFAGPGWAMVPVIAFALFRFSVSVTQRRRRSAAEAALRGPVLLVLRVFSLGRRNEILFDVLTRQWRHIGSVQLIAGTDLARATVAPHRFLAFVAGGLGRLFIRDRLTLSRALAAVDTRPDADGRYRINDFFCHADTWQSVLSGLIGITDVVLMDLRSFTRGNAGCIFEIHALLGAVPAKRLTFVVDDTTDRVFLQQTLEQAWRALPPQSPNARLPPTALALHSFDSAKQQAVQALLRRLCTAAGATARSPGQA